MTQPTPRSRHQSLVPGAVPCVASLMQRSTVTVAPVGGWPVTAAPASGLAWAVGAPEMVAVRAARLGVAKMSRVRMSRGLGRMVVASRGGWGRQEGSVDSSSVQPCRWFLRRRLGRVTQRPLPQNDADGYDRSQRGHALSRASKFKRC